MSVNNGDIICPYCTHKHSVTKLVGQCCHINICGKEAVLTCDNCGKEFECVAEVSIICTSKVLG